MTEAMQIDTVRVGFQDVSAGTPGQPEITVIIEQPANPGDVRVQASPGTFGRILTPYPVDQRFGGDHAPRVDRQSREYRTSLRGADVDSSFIGDYQDRPQQADLSHWGFPNPPTT
jgi:hypothetical protein